MTIFVHVPKTGGTSVRSACDVMSYEHEPCHRVAMSGPSFGFVRNPWDRMISLFYFLTRGSMSRHSKEGRRYLRAIGFRRWLLDNVPENGGFQKGIPDGATMQTLSQMWWLEGCDRIGRFENLEGDLRAIGRDLGFYVRDLPHLNRSPRGNYRRYYDAETRAFVAEHFAPEIEQFGYEF